jgi:hypothetical protein
MAGRSWGELHGTCTLIGVDGHVIMISYSEEEYLEANLPAGICFVCGGMEDLAISIPMSQRSCR